MPSPITDPLTPAHAVTGAVFDPRVSTVIDDGAALTLRPAAVVMDLDRLGMMQPSRLSFMRTLVRRMVREAWRITEVCFALDDDGYGEAIYCLEAGPETYHFVVFSKPLEDALRNDRVISNQWDLTMALVRGQLSDEQLDQLRRNVPLQEAGRMDENVLVLSRANRSARSFAEVVGRLATGQQPDVERLKVAGYLCRTTAVYGSGKFGMAGWHVVKTSCRSFRTPFSGEMFTCYMLRHFSCRQVEHIARRQSPGTAVTIAPEIERYIGIGNATGLGMAPFLIRHPVLISHWMIQREIALARILNQTDCDAPKRYALQSMLRRVVQHLQETTVAADYQTSRNQILIAACLALIAKLSRPAFCAGLTSGGWKVLLTFVEDHYGPAAEELVQVLLFELYPHLVDPLEESMAAEERLDLDSGMTLVELLVLLETHYDWALHIDFDDPNHHALFWYRSEEKMEPRLGDRACDAGAEREMPLLVALGVRQCFDAMQRFLADNPESLVVDFLIAHPDQLATVRRVQTMCGLPYGDIRGNLSDRNLEPMHLLRAKLSFFGVGKFDPKSKLWVRNTMFQGAPIIADLSQDLNPDHWYFPTAPVL